MKIEWNKVTWYSKSLAVVVLIVTIYLGIWFKRQFAEVALITANSPQATDTTPVVIKDGQYCFALSKKATPSEPYSVEEHVALTLNGTEVDGIKKGNQSGPDMTNGYTGTLTGTKTGSDLKLVWAYTIEGSQNKELETYTISNNSLIKHRFPLMEKGDMLVGNETQTGKDIIYTKEPCKFIQY